MSEGSSSAAENVKCRQQIKAALSREHSEAAACSEQKTSETIFLLLERWFRAFLPRFCKANKK